MKNIEKFVSLYKGLSFHKGEIGFGRPCVGIIDESTDHYVVIRDYDDDYEIRGESSAACDNSPEYAYHKHPCLAVLVHGDYEESTRQLEEWIGKILESDFEFYTKPVSKNDINTLLGNFSPIVCIRDKK